MAQALKADELYNCCGADTFSFATTGDIKNIPGTIGQERALGAMDFGLGLESKGFNIFALGELGTGKMRTIKALLSGKAMVEKVPPDWCYVYNFKDPDTSTAVALEPGMGVAFQNDMNELIKTLQGELPKTLESKDYEKQRAKKVEEFQQKQKDLFSKLEEEASSHGFAIRKAVSGLLIVPVKKSGEPLTEEEFASLDEKTRDKVEELGKQFQEKLDDVVRDVREAEKQTKNVLANLEREIALGVIGPPIEELKLKYEIYEKVVSYRRTDFSPAFHEQAETGSLFCALLHQRHRQQCRVQGRACGHREQSHLPQPFRPDGVQSAIRNGHHRFHHDQSGLPAQVERRLYRDKRPRPAEEYFLLRCSEEGNKEPGDKDGGCS
jgi:hypothetical protein